MKGKNAGNVANVLQNVLLQNYHLSSKEHNGNTKKTEKCPLTPSTWGRVIEKVEIKRERESPRPTLTEDWGDRPATNYLPEPEAGTKTPMSSCIQLKAGILRFLPTEL